ncbi:translational activator of GCN4 [Blastocladiella emersonii ATCC 22665]|nr:translational activator of GCN4 [Blastocladiella emersonii ATCC 22665]
MDDSAEFDAVVADPTPELLRLLGACGGNALAEWISEEVVPLIQEKDSRVLTPELVRSVLPLVLHRYAAQPKAARAAPLRILTALLAASAHDAKLRGSVVEATVKVVDALVLKPTAAGKLPHAVALSSILYAQAWVAECMAALGEGVPLRLFAIHCTLIGLALHHPDSAPNVVSPSKFLYKTAAGKALAPVAAPWIVADKLGADLVVVHGSLVELSRMLRAGRIAWSDDWVAFLVKHLVTCKYAVPAKTLRTLRPLLAAMAPAEILAASEKVLLRSPEVILPFLAEYLAVRDATEPLAVKESITTSLANQLISSNEANGALARTVFKQLWTVADADARASLTTKALATLPRCTSWQLKHNVYLALKSVQLTPKDIETAAKNVKAEANDTVATLVYEILAAYHADHMDTILGTWTRVNDKVRKQVLQVMFDAGALVPADKIATVHDHLALAHVLRAGTFDAKRDAKKVAALVALKSADACYVHCLNLLAQDHPGTLTPAQLENALALTLASPHVTLLSPALAADPAVFVALTKYTTGINLASPPVRKHYLAVLHHLKSEATLLDLLLFAHHPVIPEDSWPALAFHCKVHIDKWLPPRAPVALERVRAGLFSTIAWEREAGLRAASTLVWIDGSILPELMGIATQLVAETKASKKAVADAIEAAAAAAAVPTPKGGAAKGGRPGSAAGGKKPTAAAAPAAPAIPAVVDNTPLVLALITAATTHGSALDNVIQSIMEILREIDINDPGLPAAWRAVCGCLDASVSSIHSTLASLLVTFHHDSANSASQDDMISSVLFQVAMKTQTEPVHPVTFVVLYELMIRVLASAKRRSRTTDKVVLNRVLDHVAFMVDIMAQNAALAFSPILPVEALMRDQLELLRTWRKQAGKSHEALVTLCHASPVGTPGMLQILLDGCANAGQDHVVAACLEACLYVKTEFPTSARVLVHALGAHPMYTELAKQVIEKHQLTVDLEVADELVLLAENAPLASCAASFLGKLLARDAEASRAKADALHTLITKRFKAAMVIPVLKDEFGMTIKVEKDTITPRLGLVECLAVLAPYLNGTSAPLKQWVPLLDDASSDVRGLLQQALRAYIHAHSNKEFIAVLQGFAKHKNDDVRESVVVLTGACATHLGAKDPQLKEIVTILIAALRTPSETVQTAVAQCLGELPVDAKTLLPGLVNTLFTEESYAVQRGAAYGAAGLLASHPALFVEFKLMEAIRKNLDAKELRARQGALLLLECCTISMGRQFEPWLILATPNLLALFADTNAAVRQATVDTARVMMKHISSHAVKLLMPTLMEGLRSDAWRTKKASIELLSSMAFCAADKLSGTLPTLVPAMLEAMSDSHLQVSKAAREAINTFASVINTPEIEVMVPMLLDAIIHGEAKTLPALQALSFTTFEHYLDPPSLALVAPVVLQGLTSRSADMKSTAAKILGNLTSLTMLRDLMYYIPNLMPALLLVVADAVPKTRAMASRTLGILVRNVGQSTFPSLVPDLFRVLDNPAASAVEKSGAAQGLSEVLAALGKESLDAWMPTILEGLNSSKRDGYLVLLVYLPATYGATYTEYISSTLPPILDGLADEAEMVRDSALRAAQILIDLFNAKAIDLLLPELIKGVYNPSWRIRQSSVHLLGDMLGRIMGQKVKSPAKSLGNDLGEDGAEDEEDEDSDSDDDEPVHQTHTQQIKKLQDALGMDMYQRTLASLYVLRADASGVVRHTASHVWRMLVSNTPRQLKDILPVLLEIILEYLAREPPALKGADGDDEDDDELVEVDELEEIVQTIANTLVDIVQKLGDSIVTMLMPLLVRNLEESPRGVCMALIHVMKAAGRHHMSDHRASAVQVIAFALKHPSEEVREAGAAAFDELLQQAGNASIDAVLMPMLKDLPDSLSGLQHVMSVRGHVVLPVLLPSLLAKVDEASCSALASLLSVASLGRKTASVLASLLDQYNSHVVPAIRALLSHDLDEDDLDDLSEVLDEHREGEGMAGVATAIAALAPHATQWYKQQWLGWLIAELATEDAALVPLVYEAMDAVVKSIPKDELEGYVATVAIGLSKHFSAAKTAAGGVSNEVPPLAVFAQHPRGPAPPLAIVLHTLMYGAHKEQAVRALILIIAQTPGANLRAHVTAMTGPLIRILGDRVTGVVKALILEAVTLLLTRVALMLKPFIPQLSRTLVKQLDSDEAKVLAKAQEALTVLLGLHPRPDTLLAELAALVSADRDAAAVNAIGNVLVVGAQYAKDAAPLRAAVDALKAAGAPVPARELANAVAAKFPAA